MKKLCTIPFLMIGILLFKPHGLYSQNLVPNAGAETGPCPTNQDQVPNATSWTRAGGSPDYFGIGCGFTWTSSYFRPCSNRMVGFYTEWTPYNSQTPEYREYAQVQLTSPLVAGTRYCVSFYTHLATNMGGVSTATDNLGAYFTTTAVTAPSPPGNGPYNITPQIESPKGVPILGSSGWVLVWGSFVAAGGEQYVTFGNFHNQAGTTYSNQTANMRSYYFIDDILVKDCSANTPFNAVITAASNNVCPGQCTTVSATVTGGAGGPYAYMWSPNIGTGLGPFSVCPTTTTVYNFAAIDSTGCTQTVVAATTITVSGSCGPIVTTTNNTVCPGLCNSITAIGSGGTAPYTYSWTPGGGTGSSISVCPTTNTTYTVISTDNTGATASNIATITIVSPPTVNITGTTNVCPGQSTTLTATGGGTYSWSTGANTSAITVSPVTTTNYTVTVNNGGCMGSATVQVTVGLKANFTITPPGPVSPNTVITFTDISTGGGTPSWKFGDLLSGVNNTSLLSSPTHTYTSEGNYCITLTSVNATSGCSDSVTKCIIVIGQAVISIPNVFTPNNDGVNDLFYITTYGIKELTCDIFDRWGLKISHWDNVSGGWDGRTTSGSNATDGVYYYIMKATPMDDGKVIEKQGFLELER